MDRAVLDTSDGANDGAKLLKRIEAVKQRYGGGVSDFEPMPLDFAPSEPFAQKGTKRERRCQTPPDPAHREGSAKRRSGSGARRISALAPKGKR
ncbi:MAG: hypothetical protein QOF89_5329 [Acidobacteriota bacterium]|nr:hypothetical protein [Acidobacteriota bacterium]